MYNEAVSVQYCSGAAGATCVETLRQEGFTGRVVLICKENHLPYDRPKLSKAMDSAADKLYLRSHDFYKVNIVACKMCDFKKSKF